MLAESYDIPLGRPPFRQVTPAVIHRRINPKLIYLFINFLENAVTVFSAFLTFVIAGGSHKLTELIVILTSLIMIICKKIYVPKQLAVAVTYVEFIRRLIKILSVSVLPIFTLSLIIFYFKNENEEIFRILQLDRILWLWTAVTLTTALLTQTSIWVTLRFYRNRGLYVKSIAIVGAGKHADHLVKWLNRVSPASIKLLGVFDDRTGERAAQLPLRHLVQGTIDDLLRISEDVQIDQVLVALPHAARERLSCILNKLRHLPADITLAPELIAFASVEERPSSAGALPFFDVYPNPVKSSGQIAKSAFDRAVAAALIILFLPTMLVIALVIFLDSPGPILFRQPRYGLGQKQIVVLKFRTMYSNLSDPVCSRQTEVGDKRTTRVGRWLRRLSFDELPQLFNVVRGDMSLVGPRPLAIGMRVDGKLNQDLVPEYRLRHRVKPGITGWAQIHGLRGAIYARNALEERVRYDLYYVDNWSFWLDMRILSLTAKVVAFTKNAY